MDDDTYRVSLSAELCAYSLLGVIDDGTLPDAREFDAVCTCGAFVRVISGQIPAHYAPIKLEVSQIRLPQPVEHTLHIAEPSHSAPSAFFRPPNCGCECHSTPGVKHVAACCDAPPAPERKHVEPSAEPETPVRASESPENGLASIRTNSAESPEIPTSGNDATLSQTKKIGACGARTFQIADGRPCVENAGHSGKHLSIYRGRAYRWSDARLRG